jgi:hypothetical protein
MRAAAEAAITAARGVQAAPAVSAPEAGAEASPEESAEAAPSAEIPPQYEGMPAWLVEEMWVDPIYIDEAKNVETRRRRDAAIAAIRAREERAARGEAAETVAGERAAELRAELGTGGQELPPPSPDPFSNFKLEHGKTGQDASGDAFWWWSYKSEEAQRLKSEGNFSWGEHRIYFDAPVADLVALRDLVLQVAAREKVAVAFKFLDTAKTAPSNIDGKETRFVANFANPEDAARFYRTLASDERYRALTADRHQGYQGLRLDPLAEYACGYREQRGALERILAGRNVNGSEWEWADESGKVRRGRLDTLLLDRYRELAAELAGKVAVAEAAFAVGK